MLGKNASESPRLPSRQSLRCCSSVSKYSFASSNEMPVLSPTSTALTPAGQQASCTIFASRSSSLFLRRRSAKAPLLKVTNRAGSASSESSSHAVKRSDGLTISVPRARLKRQYTSVSDSTPWFAVRGASVKSATCKASSRWKAAPCEARVTGEAIPKSPKRSRTACSSACSTASSLPPARPRAPSRSARSTISLAWAASVSRSEKAWAIEWSTEADERTWPRKMPATPALVVVKSTGAALRCASASSACLRALCSVSVSRNWSRWAGLRNPSTTADELSRPPSARVAARSSRSKSAWPKPRKPEERSVHDPTAASSKPIAASENITRRFVTTAVQAVHELPPCSRLTPRLTRHSTSSSMSRTRPAAVSSMGSIGRQ
mmetsp:Transcript_23779/g.56346  ORF Transcript_23779/g.56346 Transcript_23779/m.56346 type:complete len:377 (+) Transcript_23779:182-1312(+)